MTDEPGRSSASARATLTGWVPAVVVLLVVFAAAVWTGGFRDPARFALVMVGAFGFLITALRSPARLSEVLSTIPVLALLAMSALGVVSLLWTEAEAGPAALLALVPTALAGVAVFAACDSVLREHRTVLAVCLGFLAAAGAVTGLIGVLFETQPWTFQLAGRWRPAGFLEYPPALALLQLAAMPILGRGLLDRRRSLSAPCGAALMLGSATIFLAQSKMVLTLACLLVATWVIWPDRTLSASRRDAATPVTVWLLGGVLLVLGIRLLDSGAAVAACGVLLLLVPWLVEIAVSKVRAPVIGTGHGGHRGYGAAAMVGAALAAIAVLVAPTLTDPSLEGVQGEQGVDHGRVSLWADSMPAVGERPLLGHGQGSYLAATLEDQEDPVRFAHSLVVESAVELGLVGALLATTVLLSSLYFACRRRHDPGAWLYIPMVVGFCGLGFVDWTWHLAGLGAVWALCLGSILAPPSPQDDALEVP